MTAHNPTSTVLLTGASGFLGGIVHEVQRRQGHQVTCLGRRRIETGHRFIQADLSKGPPNLKADAARFDTVLHLAGLAHTVPRGRAAGQRFFEVNTLGTSNLIEALEAAGPLPRRFVFASTVAVYGREAGLLIDEDTARAATDPYGQSKWRAEELLTEWAQNRGIELIILRLPLIAGRNAPGNLGAMVAALQRSRYLRVGDGLARRSIVLASDVANLLAGADLPAGVFHLTDGHHPSFLELEQALCRSLQCAQARSLPMPMARGLAMAGDLLSTLRMPTPFSSRALRKMTTSLTFCDQKARQQLGWQSTSVVAAVEDWACSSTTATETPIGASAA